MVTFEREEKSVLASILFGSGDDKCKGLAIDAVAGLSESSFYSPNRREIFNGIKKCLAVNCTPDLANVLAHISEDAQAEVFGMSGVSTTNDISILIRRLRDAEHAREILMFSYGLQNRIDMTGNLSAELSEISSDMSKLLMMKRTKAKDEGFMSDFCADWYKAKEEQINTKETGYLNSGIQILDRAVCGFRGGDTVVIAGRTGMGKSSLAATMIVNQLFSGFRVALFSLELGRVEIFDKAVSMFSDIDTDGECVPFRSIHNPSGAFGGVGLSKSQLKRISEIVDRYMKPTRFYAKGTGRTTIEEIMATTRKLVHDGECDALYIDHIGLLVQDKNKEREELTHITNSLRIFAGEMKIPVFEVVQMNRTADTTKERPKSGSMKGSGSIEEDASIILMPWRPFAIDKDQYKPEEAEIIVQKGRNGGEGSVPVEFCTRTTRFKEVVHSFGGSNNSDNVRDFFGDAG